MTARPWMPLYVADYLADTAHLNAAESGAYLHLIMHYWLNGGLPTDDKQLARVARMTALQWRAAKIILADFFQDGWKHKRIDAELARVAEVSIKRRASAMQRHSKTDAIAPANAEQLDTHSHSHSHLERKEDSIPADAGSTSAVYAFESGVIRLKQKDFDQWKRAFTHLDVGAELVGLTEWAATQARWFPAVSGALAKRNREAALKLEQAKNGPEFKWKSGIEGVV